MGRYSAFFIAYFVSSFLSAQCDGIMKIVILVESPQKDTLVAFGEAVKTIEASNKYPEMMISNQYIELNRRMANESMDKLCSLLYEGVSVILDFTRIEWDEGLELISAAKVLYLKLDTSISPFLEALDGIVQRRDGNDVVLIFQNDKDLEDSIHYLIEESHLRVLPLNGFAKDTLMNIENLRPSPGYYAVFATVENMIKIKNKVVSKKLLKRPDKWHFAFLDSCPNDFDTNGFAENVTLIKCDEMFACEQGKTPSLNEIIIAEILQVILEATRNQKLTVQKLNCNNYSNNAEYFKGSIAERNRAFFDLMQESRLLKEKKGMISYRLNFSIYQINNGELAKVAMWIEDRLEITIKDTVVPAKRFFRIGTTEAIPWSYIRRDPVSRETILDNDGNPVWEGYCIDLIAKLAEKMSFDYEIVVPRIGSFGKRYANGTWDGLVGDLVIGDTDIAVAALKMTAEREEVIDFIAPYFEQTGISIVIRKPYRQTSLFKFMTVLRLEVWLSIVAALVATAIMIWLLDKYSPYSARNDSKSYPYPCRDFSLKECFWFALTSFTPQGGGEVPKSISARTLIAAYWLFVVLMLATFTANLAAFLTVERMQTPVQSLEQLARQSRINYTVVEGSDTHKYFINMKFAEDTLYRLWKELTLNATSDQSQYRIWDYPIKEQYGHILLAINSSNPVGDAAEGFRKVSEHENADFALIHDSAEIKYEISKNCNLTEVGEVFAEQPYAIAIQQGSHLQDEITYALLELQKDRFLEGLTAKYWNNSAKRECDSIDEGEGITLESLGGVFIATLFGLGLAMVTLVVEVIYYRRKQPQLKKVRPFDHSQKNHPKPDLSKVLSNRQLPAYEEVKNGKSVAKQVTLAKDFVPARKRNTNITYIGPRNPIHKSHYYE